MVKLKQNYDQLLRALETLQKTLEVFAALEQKTCNCCTTNEEAYRIHRDSVVQRFEYSIDVFWKYLKKYLEDAQVLSGMAVPIEVVRVAYSNKIVTEDEAESIIKMIKSRNKTSHMYVEEVAEQLAGNIPGYYQVMLAVASRLLPNELEP